MTTVIRDFDKESRAERMNRPRIPIEQRQFKLGGETLAYAEVVPAQAVIGLGVALKSNDMEVTATALADAILSLLDESCHGAFYRALDAREDGLPMVENSMLNELYLWLMEQASKRPPTPPSDSPPPPASNGTQSTVG